MTVLVGILNKQAVAVAADSAATVGGGAKIYNTANKIFNLAKGRPVGIGIYGNAALNGCVPWEVVIKMYREYIGSQKFDKLSDYVNHFFEYVKEYSRKYISEEAALGTLKRNIMKFWCGEFTKGLRESDEIDAPIAKLALSILKVRLEELYANLKKYRVLDEYKTIKIEGFVAAIGDILDVIKKQITRNGGEWEEYAPLIEESLYRMFVTDALKNPNISGVAIFGYGEEEIYPSHQEFQVYNIVLGVQRICQTSVNVINEKNGASICPMAQKDVIEILLMR